MNAFFSKLPLSSIVCSLLLWSPQTAMGQDDLEDGVWTRHAASHTPRTEGAAISYEGRLYALAGFERDVVATHLTEVYDPANDTWSVLAPIPRAVSHVGAALVDGTVWIVGGFEGDHPGPAVDVVQIYDIATDTWSDGPPLPSPRASGALVLLGRHLHYFGGLLPDRVTDVDEHLVLDVDHPLDGWTLAAPLPNPRNHLSGAVYEGRIYAIGGQFGHDGGRTLSALVHVYDVATDTWSQQARLPLRRSHAEASTFVYNGQIIVAGGVGPGPNRTASIDHITGYDPLKDTWVELGRLPQELLGPGVRVIDGRMFAAGGSIGLSGNALDSTWSTAVDPPEKDTLGFWPAAIELHLESGQERDVDLYLWTHRRHVDVVFDDDDLPEWLAVQDPSAERAAPTGSPIRIEIDAAHLEAGTYRDTVVAAAPGYPPATLPITLQVSSAPDPTSVEDEMPASDGFALSANFPNPFSDRTLIRFSLETQAPVTLAIYDLLGRHLATIVDDVASPGEHVAPFDAGHLANGVYICELRMGNRRQARHIVLQR